MKQSNNNGKTVKYYLYILLICFLHLSCSREDKDVRILKKISKDYVTAFSSEFERVTRIFKENSIVIVILQMDRYRNLSTLYPDYSIYVFFYTNDLKSNIENNEIPSKLFYVKDYPVALYSDHIPPMKKSDIPESVFRKKNEGTWVDDGCDWYVVICKKNHKYKVLPNPYLQPDSVIFGQGLKDFSCD